MKKAMMKLKENTILKNIYINDLLAYCSQGEKSTN